MSSRPLLLVGATFLLGSGCAAAGDPGIAETGSEASGEPTSPDSTSTSSDAGDSATTTASSSTSSASTTGDPLGCPPTQLGACVEPERYQTDLQFIADLRVPGSTHWEAVQELCADRLAELGFDVQMFSYGSGVDVLGTRTGSGTGGVVMIGAHYDHIDGCVGADDNATGVAAALEAARVLAMGSFEHDLVVACWDEEERGLIGSSAFVDAAVAQQIDILDVFNFEMLGYASNDPDTQRIPPGFDLIFADQVAEIDANDSRGNFLFIAADDLSGTALASLEAHAETYALPVIAVELTASQKKSDLFGDLRRSDHAPFWNADLPAMFITDTGEFRNDNYHCIGGEDTVQSLSLPFTEKVMRTVVSAAADALVRDD